MLLSQTKDYGPTAATYLKVLGWLNLLGLNLGGLIWLWFASKLRERSNGFRKAAVALLGLHVLTAGLLSLTLLLNPHHQPKLQAFGHAVHVGPVALVFVAVAFAAVFLTPMIWLLAPGTRAHFERRVERKLCMRCGYDLRASTERCPECGTPTQPA